MGELSAPCYQVQKAASLWRVSYILTQDLMILSSCFRPYKNTKASDGMSLFIPKIGFIFVFFCQVSKWNIESVASMHDLTDGGRFAQTISNLILVSYVFWNIWQRLRWYMPLPREESLRKICMNVGWMCITISFLFVRQSSELLGLLVHKIFH